MTRVFIHVGMPKAASTTLQNLVFKKHSGLHANYERNTCPNALQDFFSKDSFEIDYKTIEEKLRSLKSSAGEKAMLISHPNFASAFSPLHEIMPARLKRVAPEAEIILVMRNQKTEIQSYYSEHGNFLKHVPKPWDGRRVSFPDWFDCSIAYYREGFLPSLRYDLLLKNYVQNFGKENIHVLLYERLVGQQVEFLDHLSHILGIDAAETRSLFNARKPENLRRSSRYHSYQTVRNALLPNLKIGLVVPPVLKREFYKFLAGGSKYNPILTKEMSDKISALYAEGNGWVAKEFGLPLDKFAYPV